MNVFIFYLCTQRKIWLLSYHFGNALIFDAKSNSGFLRLLLSICHANDMCDISGLNVTRSLRWSHLLYACLCCKMRVNIVRWVKLKTREKFCECRDR